MAHRLTRSASPPSPEEPLQGGCLCGAVRFEITAPFLLAGYCHCTHCQRRTGTGSSANGRVPQAGFRLLQGQEQLRSFQPPERRAQAVLRDLRLGAVQRRPAQPISRLPCGWDTRPRSGHPPAVPAVRGLGRTVGAASAGRARALSALTRGVSDARSRSHASDQRLAAALTPAGAASALAAPQLLCERVASTSTRPPPSAAAPDAPGTARPCR